MRNCRRNAFAAYCDLEYYFLISGSGGGHGPLPLPASVRAWLNYRRETALRSKLVLAKSGRLELGDHILRTL